MRRVGATLVVAPSPLMFKGEYKGVQTAKQQPLIPPPSGGGQGEAHHSDWPMSFRAQRGIPPSLAQGGQEDALPPDTSFRRSRRFSGRNAHPEGKRRGANPPSPLDSRLRGNDVGAQSNGRVLLICRRVLREYVHPPSPLTQAKGEVYTPLRAASPIRRPDARQALCRFWRVFACSLTTG